MIGSDKNHQTPVLSRPGLQLLLQAHEYAHELDRDVWDFAVELSALHKTGLSYSDLRWLVCKRLVNHACETTSESDTCRVFGHRNDLALWERSCFVLTNSGVEFVQTTAQQIDIGNNEYRPLSEYTSRILGGSNGGTFASSTRASKQKLLVPTWDCDRQELRLGSQVVKEFRLHSPNQSMILTAFEEEGWPPKVDDPLPPHAEIDAKQRLHDTIKSLNRGQKLKLIRFRGDGTGQGIRWELRQIA